MESEFLLADEDGTARHPEFSRWSRDVVFPVKLRCLIGSRQFDYRSLLSSGCENIDRSQKTTTPRTLSGLVCPVQALNL
jgi:hypothetical protein